MLGVIYGLFQLRHQSGGGARMPWRIVSPAESVHCVGREQSVPRRELLFVPALFIRTEQPNGFCGQNDANTFKMAPVTSPLPKANFNLQLHRAGFTSARRGSRSPLSDSQIGITALRAAADRLLAVTDKWHRARIIVLPKCCSAQHQLQISPPSAGHRRRGKQTSGKQSVWCGL